jgi:segregation and condensation protein A
MLNIRLDSFEGPLDLLLHLIDREEVDIYEVSVAKIADQYVSYIRQMQQLELEIASEFLVMASSLLAMKSRMLLPKPEEADFQLLDIDEESFDPEQELIRRLIEYKKYKSIASVLREKETERSQVFTRPAENLSVFIDQEEVNPVANISLFDLMNAFQEVLREKEMKPYKTIERDEISIEARMKQLIDRIRQATRLLFTQLFEADITKNQIIVTFLAILELMKKKQVFCEQDALFGDIWITKGANDIEEGDLSVERDY